MDKGSKQKHLSTEDLSKVAFGTYMYSSNLEPEKLRCSYFRPTLDSLLLLGIKQYQVFVCLILLSWDTGTNPGPEKQNQNALTILHLNLRSSRYKIPSIETISDEYGILCYTETY